MSEFFGVRYTLAGDDTVYSIAADPDGLVQMPPGEVTSLEVTSLEVRSGSSGKRLHVRGGAPRAWAAPDPAPWFASLAEYDAHWHH